MIQIDNIPAELKALSSWVCWDYMTRNGRTTKPPISPHGGFAKCNEPMTWGTFEEALNAQKQMGYAGISFAFTDYDPYVGIDIDAGCNQLLRKRIINAMGSYTELSPSGNGVHIIARGTLPHYGRKNDKLQVEMYPNGRFFTVTGNVYQGNTEITSAQEAINKIHGYVFPKPAEQSRPASQPLNANDEAIIERMKRNHTLNNLFEGHWKGHYASQSTADMRLCGAIAYFVGPDAERIDRIFRQSKLYNTREGQKNIKWDRQARRGETYGQGTIRIAIQGAGH